MKKTGGVRKMLTMNEVLALLGVNRTTLYRWVWKNEFPKPLKVGPSTVRFYEDEVVAWQQAHEAK